MNTDHDPFSGGQVDDPNQPSEDLMGGQDDDMDNGGGFDIMEEVPSLDGEEEAKEEPSG